MGRPETNTDQGRYEDVFGQFPQLKTYNHGLFLFPIADDTSRQIIVEALKNATAKVVAEIPWLAKQVICEGKVPGHSGKYTLAAWPSETPLSSLIHVKDCSDICPPYADLIKAQAPISLLDGSILCPFPGFPLSYSEAEIGPAPVIAVQANFVKGGLLLNFSNQHNMMDATGLFTFIMLLASAMRGESIPQSILKQANRAPGTVVPLLDEGETIKDHSHLVRPSNSAAIPQASPSAMAQPRYQWAYFRFLKPSIAKVKALATMPEGTNGQTVPFISSNDALCAFYWKRLAAVRINNGHNPPAISKFSRAIDARTAMNVPMGYMGQLVYQSATHLSLEELTSTSLPVITAHLRSDLNEANTPFAIRSYATFLGSVSEKATLAYAGVFNPATDIGSSSMSTAQVSLSFGILGEPELCRRPRLAPVPGCLYFYPPEAKGDLPVLVCLKEEELMELRADKEWSECTEYIG